MDKDKVVELAVSVLVAKVRNDHVYDYETELKRMVRAIIEAENMLEQEYARRYK